MTLGRFIENRLMKINQLSLNGRVMINKVLRIALYVIAVVIALDTIGLDLTFLSVFGGAFGVGLAFGMQKRFVSDGIYWINKAEKEINRFKDEYNHFITDVRFPNEVLKIKELGGKCIHIEREGNSPPNLEEEENEPIIKSMSDFNFKWKDFSDSELDTAKDLARHFIKYKFNGRG